MNNHFANFVCSPIVSTGSRRAKTHRFESPRIAFRSLAILFCVALSFAPTLAEAETICFLSVLKLRDGGLAEAQTFVINSETEWQNLWERMFSNTSVKPPLPEIDFTGRTIVAVFQGIQPSGGYEIAIQEIVETENTLEVVVKAFAPGKRCVVPGAVTRPFDIVEIEKTEKEAVFHVKHRVRNCG